MTKFNQIFITKIWSENGGKYNRNIHGKMLKKVQEHSKRNE